MGQKRLPPNSIFGRDLRAFIALVQNPTPNGLGVMNEMIPSEFHLSQNYPDPCRGSTTIKFCLAHKAWVKLDVLGADYGLVTRLVDKECEAGTFEAIFDATETPEGTYMYIFQAAEHVITKKLTVKR